MNGAGVLHLGLRYLARHRAKATLLVLAFSLAAFLPVSLSRIIAQVEETLRSRAVDTDLVLGHAGSALELTFNALYFTKPEIETVPYGEVAELNQSGLAVAIPLYARFSAGAHRIVGTNLDYFHFRDFSYEQGRALLHLGECVIGAEVADANDISVGDAVISSPESLFDLAGVYPLKMRVCGVLERTGTADDRAIFVDVKTAWIIEGLGHGHEDASELPDDQRLGEEEDGAIRLNASIREYNEITPDNADQFHFHGDEADLPLTAVIVDPFDAKGQALLKGRYAARSDRQLIVPQEEMDELFATVFQVRSAVLAMLIAVGVGTLLLGVIVFLLSYRLRKDEFRHLRNLGASPGTLRALIGFEAGFVILASLLLSIAALWLVGRITPWMLERVLG